VADSLDDLIHRADLDDLVRHVESTCAARDWVHLVRVRDRARAAVDTGRQLWPIATLANHRMALHAPAEIAVRALADPARTFMPGPVSEILAVHHDWHDLEPHLPPGHDRALVAHERSLRGDAVDAAEPSLLDIPVALQEWEPAYTLATYDDDGVDAPPAKMTLSWSPVETRETRTVEVLGDDETVHTFRQMMAPWTTGSNGSARATVVRGDAHDAVAVHASDSAHADGIRIAAITASDALAALAWAAASGGAHGRRRGAATGRSEAWWLLAVFTGLDQPWPADPDEFGEVIGSLECFAFENDGAPTGGWGLGLVLVDRDEGLSVSLSARDSVESR